MVRSKTQRSPSSLHQKYICMWTTPTEHLLNVGRRCLSSKRHANPHIRGEVGRETKESRQNLNIWEWAVKDEKFLHTWKPSLAQGQGCSSETQRRAQQPVCRRQNGENSEQRSKPTSNTHPEMCVCMPTREGGRAECWGQGFGGQNPGRALGLSVKTVWED